MHSKTIIAALALGIASLSLPAFAAEQVPDSCPVTKAPYPAFEPPAPHSANDTGRFWLGTKALWTSLDEDGIWKGIVSERGTRNKFWWWREGWKYDTDWRANEPGLIISARRIDGDAPVVKAPRVTNGELSTGWAMLTVFELPTSGCWEITGNYRSEYLSMVVWVPDKPLDEAR